MNIINIYHKKCLDGLGSACAVDEYAKANDYNLSFIPMSHGYTNNDVNDFYEKLEGVDRIYFTDFCMRYNDMLQLMRIFKGEVIIIDHHKGVEEDLIKLKKEFSNIKYIFDNNKSGAVLAWEYFFDMDYTPDMIYNIQDRDLWRFELNDTKIITSYLFEFIDEDVSIFKSKLYNKATALSIGIILCQKREKTISNIVKDFKDKYLILKCKSLPSLKIFNQYEYKSELGNIFSEDFNEPVGIFHIEGNNVCLSIRSCDKQKYTANEYAKQFGGNGHKNASGCQIDLNYFLNNVSIPENIEWKSIK